MKNTPYLTLTGEVWDVFHGDLQKTDQVIMALHYMNAISKHFSASDKGLQDLNIVIICAYPCLGWFHNFILTMYIDYIFSKEELSYQAK